MSTAKTRTIDELIRDVCKTILICGDTVDLVAVECFIKNLNASEKVQLNNHSTVEYRQIIRAFAQREIIKYIKYFQKDKSVGSPFEFDTVQNYNKYIARFTQIYKEENNAALPPYVFTYVFEYIKEVSQNYSYFEMFYALQREDIEQEVQLHIRNLSNTAAKKAAQEATKEASKLADDARNVSEQAAMSAEVAKFVAKDAANRAQEAVTEAEYKAKQVAQNKAEETLSTVVNEKMQMLNSKLSETSVTILGIFSGIVLTVVAGLFYSSSVLENINSANFFRLICVASLVGLVCIHVLVAMFRFIERIGKGNEQACLNVQSKQDDKTEKNVKSQNVVENKKDSESVNQQESTKQESTENNELEDKTSKINQYSNCVSVESKKSYFFSDKMVYLITAILVVVMVLGGVLQFFIPDDVAKRNDTAIPIESTAEEEQTREALTTEEPEDVTDSAENTQ